MGKKKIGSPMLLFEKMAGWDPEELRAMLVEFVERTGFNGMAPLPGEARFSVERARELPKIVEY